MNTAVKNKNNSLTNCCIRYHTRLAALHVSHASFWFHKYISHSCKENTPLRKKNIQVPHATFFCRGFHHCRLRYNERSLTRDAARHRRPNAEGQQPETCPTLRRLAATDNFRLPNTRKAAHQHKGKGGAIYTVDRVR